jgi:hypothetical protein
MITSGTMHISSRRPVRFFACSLIAAAGSLMLGLAAGCSSDDAAPPEKTACDPYCEKVTALECSTQSNEECVRECKTREVSGCEDEANAYLGCLVERGTLRCGPTGSLEAVGCDVETLAYSACRTQ